MASSDKKVIYEMSNVPVYWKTRLEDVEETLKLVKKGVVTQVETSAGGRPIYKIEYGKSNLPKGTSDNVSSALGGRSYKSYADKTGADYVPTAFFVGCVHGGEFEGTSALLNMIKQIETGTDYKGERNDELVALAERVHLVIIPMVNPDGRARFPFDSFVGRTFNDLRYYCQGTWKNGELCGHPGCKLKHPIKDHVDYMGSYFNDDGVNMMHEDWFSGNLSSGTRAVLEVCRKEAPDFSVLLHGGDNCINYMIQPTYSSLKTKKEVYQLALMIEEKSKQNNVRYKVGPLDNEGDKKEIPYSFSLPSVMHHCCSEPAVTYESNQGLCDHGPAIYDYEEIYKAHAILFAETMRYVLEVKDRNR